MPRVLVIDDQSGVRTMISLVLRINQFEIVEAATAAAALKSFEEGRFDLAIVDIFLRAPMARTSSRRCANACPICPSSRSPG